MGAHLALGRGISADTPILEGRFTMDRRRRTTGRRISSRTIIYGPPPLGKENETRFEVKFLIPDFAFEAEYWQGVVSDKIYYDADSQITQQGGNVSLTSVYACKDFA